jgi:hypothetical protein
LDSTDTRGTGEEKAHFQGKLKAFHQELNEEPGISELQGQIRNRKSKTEILGILTKCESDLKGELGTKESQNT